jgi:hypothetical protein
MKLVLYEITGFLGAEPAGVFKQPVDVRDFGDPAAFKNAVILSPAEERKEQDKDNTISDVDQRN